MNAGDLLLEVAWFSNGGEEGKPALGTPETLPWSELAHIIADNRRIGDKDGCNFIPTRFALEPGKVPAVRRKNINARARTAGVLDIELNKKTGEVPPCMNEICDRLRTSGLEAVVWTTHNHTAELPRCRIGSPLSEEVEPDLPVPEILARELGVEGVVDRSKFGPASLFYLPSAAGFYDLDRHEAYIITGSPYSAALMRQKAGALLAERQAEQDQAAAEAHAAAEKRRQERIAAGFDPDDSLIEKLRSRFDLEGVLLAHGYDKAGSKNGTKYRHPNSTSGSYGADIKVLGGIERVFSHNGTDPLHRDNLPSWCGGVSALDAVDVVTILDFAGDRTRALREMAHRFGINRAEERKVLARLLFCMIRQQAPQEAIEASAFVQGLRLGLSRAEVIAVANWVVRQAVDREAA